MKFTLLIHEGPYQHQSADTALKFIEAALLEGHEIKRVFFYHDGVYNANRLASPPTDDRQLQSLWSSLALEQNIDLVVCTAAAQRRGITDAKEAKRQGLDADNLAEGFRIAGLGQLIDSSLNSDRTIVFGD